MLWVLYTSLDFPLRDPIVRLRFCHDESHLVETASKSRGQKRHDARQIRLRQAEGDEMFKRLEVALEQLWFKAKADLGKEKPKDLGMSWQNICLTSGKKSLQFTIGKREFAVQTCSQNQVSWTWYLWWWSQLRCSWAGGHPTTTCQSGALWQTMGIWICRAQLWTVPNWWSAYFLAGMANSTDCFWDLFTKLLVLAGR